MQKRDYGLLGPEAGAAETAGLKSAAWYHSEIPRSVMKELMKRSDGPAIRDTLIYFGAMIGFAALAIYLWPSPWALLPLFCYGTLYGSAGDSRWHECGHGTAFRTPWMNDAVYQVASFFMMRNPTRWRWSHTRHHTDTIIVGLDPEIALMRPPAAFLTLLNFFGLVDLYHSGRMMLINAAGIVTEDEKTFIPAAERPKVILVARIWVLIYAATIAACFYFHSILPILLIGAPRLYGAWHGILVGLMQHGGLAEDVLDHRMNSRTVYINPISRFLYWNMNYHVEHHMFPMVPYHALPKLHALIKNDLPEPTPSIWACYKEMLPVWARQLRGENYFLLRKLPDTAKPYQPGLHGQQLPAAAE